MSNLTSQLAKRMGFTSQDLHANQMGKLSLGQRGRLSRQPFFQMFVLILMVVGMIVAGHYVYTTRPVEARWPLIGIGGFFGSAICILLVMAIRDGIKDSKGGSVYNITGPLDLRREWDDPGYSYYVLVSQSEFRISKGAYDLLRKQPYSVYRAYYLPHSRKLLSMEPVEDDIYMFN